MGAARQQSRPTPLTNAYPHWACREATLRGGAGGVWQAVLPGQGLFDAVEPRERPAGSLTVRLRYPACFLEESSMRTCLAPQPVHLLGCGRDVVGGALAAGSLAGMLAHRREAAEMAAEAAQAGAPACAGGTASRGSPCGSPRSACSSSSEGQGGEGKQRRGSSGSGATAFCLSLDLAGSSTYSGPACSPATAAMLGALQSRVPGLRARAASAGRLLDDEWGTLQRADVIILDAPWPAGWRSGGCTGAAAAEHGASTSSGSGACIPPERLEQLLAAAADQLVWSGLQELLWQRFWGGALLAGVGPACALLGRQAGDGAHSVHVAPPILPWYLLRAGGGADGWASLQAALSPPAAADSEAAAGHSLVGVGVMATGCWLAHPMRGQAELLVAPCRDALVATAAWAAQEQNDPAQRGLEEADADWGFFCELATRRQP